MTQTTLNLDDSFPGGFPGGLQCILMLVNAL